VTVTRIPRMLTAKEASEATRAGGAKGISLSTIKRDMKDGKLPSTLIRGARRILDDDFVAYQRGRAS
jgi:predicted site-specific integrase-resolvase